MVNANWLKKIFNGKSAKPKNTNHSDLSPQQLALLAQLQQQNQLINSNQFVGGQLVSDANLSIFDPGLIRNMNSMYNANSDMGNQVPRSTSKANINARLIEQLQTTLLMRQLQSIQQQNLALQANFNPGTGSSSAMGALGSLQQLSTGSSPMLVNNMAGLGSITQMANQGSLSGLAGMQGIGGIGVGCYNPAAGYGGVGSSNGLNMIIQANNQVASTNQSMQQSKKPSNHKIAIPAPPFSKTPEIGSMSCIPEITIIDQHSENDSESLEYKYGRKVNKRPKKKDNDK